MDKPVIIQFDREAYQEYKELQEAVVEGRIAKRQPPTYAEKCAAFLA